MNESSYDNRLAEEIRGLREDLRKSVRNALWVFASSVVLVCLVFGPRLSKDAMEFLALAGIVAAVCGFFYLVGLVFQAFFNARLRKRNERESFAILSGRTRAPRTAR